MFDFIGAEWSAQATPRTRRCDVSLRRDGGARRRGAVRRHRNKLKGRRAFWPAIEELSLNDGVYARRLAAAPDETEDDRDVPSARCPLQDLAPPDDHGVT